MFSLTTLIFTILLTSIVLDTQSADNRVHIILRCPLLATGKALGVQSDPDIWRISVSTSNPDSDAKILHPSDLNSDSDNPYSDTDSDAGRILKKEYEYP